MSDAASTYRVFARKYRPRTFSEVLGQDHIVHALSRAIERERVGQAYLLIGPRGVGKTTTARIIAKSLNCEQGASVTPCLECDICREIERGGDIDVIEIDGASNNGVDDVRGIRDAVQTRPIRDRRKIYIIDEVQRLSGQAFDALLKTLEEPPEHAMFLFATTDPHKIPDTIVSRCQLFEFRRLREVDIRAKLEHVCAQEGVEVEVEVLQAIARGCRGGMRDAESMLDQVLATADGRVTLDDLEQVAGLARPERWLDLFDALLADDTTRLLHEVHAFLERGGTERDFLEQAVDALRDLLHVALLGEDALGVEPAPERRDRIRELARAMGRDRLEAILGMMFQLESRMQKSPLGARALLEWTLLRAARVQQFLDLASLLQEGGGETRGSVPATAATRPSAPAPAPESAPKATPAPAPTPAREAVAPSEPAPAPEPTPAPEPEPPSEAAAAVESVTLEVLLERLVQQRPTLGELIQSNIISGEIARDEVRITLQPVSEADQSLLDDPVELRALSRLAGSPGPWRIAFHQEAPPPSDPVVDGLLELFGGQEETP